MAYIDQEQKKRIVSKVKSVLPKGFKATFKVNNHSTLVMTFTQVPREFLVGLAYKGVDLLVKKSFIEADYANDLGLLNHKLDMLMTGEKAQTLTEFAVRECHISMDANFSVEKMDNVFNTLKGDTKLLKDIVNALNSENFDNSDYMTDYVSRGYYVRVRFGDFYNDKPCKITD